MKGYKGFDKDLKCKGGYQYEIGRTETTDEVKLCKTGFHFCERPLDVFSYFAPANSRYCEIEAEDVSPETEERDIKRVAKKLTVKGEIGVAGLVKAAVNIGIEEAKSKTTGNCAHAATTGDWAHAATTGNCAYAATTGERANAATTGNWANAATTGNWAHAVTTGERAHAEVSGKESIASALGIKGKAKGALGCWIVCAEWEIKNDGWHIECVKAAAVDGKRIKADTWYMLKDGEFVEVQE